MIHGRIRLGTISDCAALTEMRAQLWPDGSNEEHARELQSVLSGEANPGFATTILVSEMESGLLAGFLETRVRSHADGCDQSQPVGYVEGWFVRKQFRRQGIGAALLKAAESWARAQGCKEMASDAEIGNEESQRAHEALGFKAGSRVVNYRKAL